MKQARFIQIVEMQNVLYALDEEGRVWRYGGDPSTNRYAWTPLSSKRDDEPDQESSPVVGFRSNPPTKG